METKICKECKLEKLLECFEKGTNKRKGIVIPYWFNKCKDCDRERVRAKVRRSKARHRQKLNDQQKAYYKINKQKISEHNKQFYLDNKERIIKRVKNYIYSRRKNDPIFRLKESISRAISTAIKKNRRSTVSILPYTFAALKNHLEKQFEPWMTWENYGVYRVDIWNDNDQATWTWQIDHIIPHSRFDYMSTEDKTFKDCWALENLRPYSAKQNVIDGDRK